MNWEMLQISKLIDEKSCVLQTGPFGTQLKASEYVSEGHPLINVKNIGYGSLLNNEYEFISPKKADELYRHKLQQGDIIFGRKGAVDRHALITKEQNDWVQGSDCLRIRFLNQQIINVKYFSYFLQTKAHKDWMFALCSFGATMHSLNQDILKRIKIPLPPLPIQKKIAAILSAYDDLIENNNKRIAILEQMAQQIYKEWFVRMRFPGYEKAKFHKGIPDGWEVRQISEISDTQYGYTTSAIPNFDSNPKFLRITDIAENRLNWETVPYCEIPDKDLEKYKLYEGDIVVARTGATAGYAKRIGKNPPLAIFASFLVRIIPKKKEYSIYLGIIIESQAYKDFIMTLSTGAAQPQANAKILTLLKILIPINELILKFNSIVEPLLSECDNLTLQNQNLKKTRDLLLPRLMSGKLDVSKLDISPLNPPKGDL